MYEGFNTQTAVSFTVGLGSDSQPIQPVTEAGLQAVSLMLDKTQSEPQELAFDPENQAEWQPAVKELAQGFVKSTSPEELKQMGDFSTVVEAFLADLLERKNHPILLDAMMRAMTQVDQAQLRPVLQAELQKAAETVTPGLNLHTAIPISSV